MKNKLLLVPIFAFTLAFSTACSDSTPKTTPAPITSSVSDNSTPEATATEAPKESPAVSSTASSKPQDTQASPSTTTEPTMGKDSATMKPEDSKASTSPSADKLKTFTLDEVKSFDGKNGNKAYVVIDGTVYDVTNAEAWKNGEHKGNNAGVDLTAKLAKAPHKDKVLKDLVVVGKLAK